MAKLPDLVRALAPHTRHAETSLKVLARMLREAGWIQTKGRGRHSAEMEPADAASLILGLAATSEWLHAPAALGRLAACVPVGATVRNGTTMAYYDETLLRQFLPALATPLHETLANAIARYASSSSRVALKPPTMSTGEFLATLKNHDEDEREYRSSIDVDPDEYARNATFPGHPRLHDFPAIIGVALAVKEWGEEVSSTLRLLCKDNAEIFVYFISPKAVITRDLHKILETSARYVPGQVIDTMARQIQGNGAEIAPSSE